MVMAMKDHALPCSAHRRQTTHAINPAVMLTELLNKTSGKIVVCQLGIQDSGFRPGDLIINRIYYEFKSIVLFRNSS